MNVNAYGHIKNLVFVCMCQYGRQSEGERAILCTRIELDGPRYTGQKWIPMENRRDVRIELLALKKS